MPAIARTITPNLWFDFDGEDAAEFYCSVFPNSRILRKAHYLKDSPGPEGAVMTVEFELDGQRFVAINGGPQFPFTEAVSFQIDCADQAEIDHYWNALLQGGGKPVQCGWLTDRFGLSWQITWPPLIDMLMDKDKAKAQRAMQAMLQMGKLDVAALEKAYAGK